MQRIELGETDSDQNDSMDGSEPDYNKRTSLGSKNQISQKFIMTANEPIYEGAELELENSNLTTALHSKQRSPDNEASRNHSFVHDESDKVHFPRKIFNDIQNNRND